MGILGLGELDSTLGWTLGSYGNRLLLRHSREFHWGWGGGRSRKNKRTGQNVYSLLDEGVSGGLTHKSQ